MGEKHAINESFYTELLRIGAKLVSADGELTPIE
jgi:hypothetical protein